MRCATETLRVIGASCFLLLAAPGNLVGNVLNGSAWRKHKAFRNRSIHAHGHPRGTAENKSVSRLVRPLKIQNGSRIACPSFCVRKALAVPILQLHVHTA